VDRLHAKIDVDSISIFKVFLEEDNCINKLGFHRHDELSRFYLASMHILSHFCLPLLDYLVESMVFYRVECTSFNNTSFMPTQNLVSIVVYCHAFNITRPNQKLAKDFTSCKGAY
jgi:hypothetical protein